MNEPPLRRETAFLSDDPHAGSGEAAMFAGALSFCRRPYARRLDGVDLAVVGAPFDQATTGRPGARLGPRAIRAASSNLAWTRPYGWPFDPFQALAVVDWGDVAFDSGRPERAADAMAAAFKAVGAAGAGVLMLGGDHFCSYPALRVAGARAAAPLALIQFDAHCDTWPDSAFAPGAAEGSEPRLDHGTMFRRAIEEGLIAPERSVQIGIRTPVDEPMGVTVIDARRATALGAADLASEIRRVVGHGPAYLSFDVDALDPAFAPGTGTPVIAGLTPMLVLETLRALAGIDLVGMDVVETAPPFDHAEITALAAATIAVELICLYAVARGRAAAE